MRVAFVLFAACGFSKSGGSNNAIDAPDEMMIDAALIDTPLAIPRYRKQIDIVDATIAGGPHLNFPFLVQWNGNSDLMMHAKADGTDLFFTDANGTPIPYQRVRYTSSGAFTGWVKIPSLTAQTVIYANYGDMDAADQQSVAATWDSSFRGVWHFDEAAGGANALRDSTVNNNHGTNLGGAIAGAAGFLDNGVTFDGTNDYVEVPNSTSLDGTANAATFSAWAKFTDPSNTRFQFIIVSGNAFDATPNGYSWATQPDGDFYIYPWVGDVNNFNIVTNPLPNNMWRHVAATFDFGNKSAFITINGVQQTNATTNTTTLWGQTASPDEWRFGGTPDDSPNYFGGQLDEIRVSNVVRSTNWLMTEFRNQNNPTGSIALGGEMTIP